MPQQGKSNPGCLGLIGDMVTGFAAPWFFLLGLGILLSPEGPSGPSDYLTAFLAFFMGLAFVLWVLMRLLAALGRRLEKMNAWLEDKANRE